MQFIQDSTNSDVVNAEDLEHLPEPVQRYMIWTGVVGKPWIKTAYVKQSGNFRLANDKPWMPMTAAQLFTTDPPGMRWNATFKLYGLPLMRARDSYQDGQGHMVGKAAGLVTLFDDRGDKLTLGTMTRYLSEMIWLPIAYLGDRFTWTAVDEQSADVAFTDHGRTVSGRMFFDELGRPTTFETVRYKGENGSFELHPWQTPYLEYGLRDGLNIPVHGTVRWILPDGELTYGDFAIDEVAYNRPGDTI